MLIILGFLLTALILYPMWFYKKFNKVYLLLIGGLLIFITAYRSISFYTDTTGYRNSYTLYTSYSIDNLLKLFSGDIKDPFYYVLGGLFAKAGITFRGWLVFVSLVYYSGFIFMLYKFSEMPLISIFVLTGLGYVFFTMTGIRQTLAFGISFYAFYFAYKRKLIPFALLVGLAALFHSSALIFLLTYFFINRKPGLLQIIILLAAIIIALLFPYAINNLVETIAWSEGLESYSYTKTGLSVAGFVIQLAILVICLIFAPEYSLKKEVGIAFLNMLIWGLVFQAFVIRIDNIFRMSMYFSVYGAFMLSNAISTVKDKNLRAVLIFASLFVCVIYLIRSQTFTYFTMFGN